ncbi:MAG: hypothetical protein ACI4I4_04305 [Acutalibacteraceae bacterium]
MKFICPYCGSSRVETTGGENGNPFDRRPQKTVCADCGRTISEYSDNILDYIEPVIKVTATAVGGGVTITAEKTVPYKDGTYSLGDEYPFNRRATDENPPYSFDSITVKGEKITIACETVKLNEQPVRIVKHLTAYAPDKHPAEETITLTISADMEEQI